MLSYLLDNIQQDPLLSIIGLFLFLILFMCTVIWTMRRDKEYIEKMRSLPLESPDKNGDIFHD